MSERTRAEQVAEEIYGARFLSDSHPDEFGVVAAAAAYRRGLEDAAKYADPWADASECSNCSWVADRIRELADEEVQP
jgi:hypothetical protein